MKHNINEFNKAVEEYKRLLKGKIKGEVLILHETSNEKAFYSIAPLSFAIHQLGGEICTFSFFKGNSDTYYVLDKIYKLFEKLKRKENSKETKALDDFLKAIKKKTKTSFEPYLSRPLEITAQKNSFTLGTQSLPFKTKWVKKRLTQQLSKTAKNICKNSYALKKHETLSLGYEMVPLKRKLPLDDYLDSYHIAYSTYKEAIKQCKRVFLSTASGKEKMTEDSMKVIALSEALRGSQYSLFSNEPIFKTFKKLSPFIEAERLQSADAIYMINGEGYGGKTLFGTKIGFPIPKSKERWTSVSTMFLKPSWKSQTQEDNRLPKTRLAITETLPLENYIKSVDQDYSKMRKLNSAIVSVLSKSKNLYAEGLKFPEGQTKLKMDLTAFLEGKRQFHPDSADMQHLIDTSSIKKGVKAGNYGNIPAGEVFFTPEFIEGTLLGDVSIHLDKSYKLTPKKPLIIKIKNSKFTIQTKNKKLKKAFENKLKESKQMISLYQKNKTLPKKTIDEYKRNFYKVGEFAINTNSGATPSMYLIEAEKAAGMIHLAVGSGFDIGTQTTHHSDTVVNAPRQKLNIYGLTEKLEKIYIMKNGKLVV